MRVGRRAAAFGRGTECVQSAKSRQKQCDQLLIEPCHYRKKETPHDNGVPFGCSK